MAWKEAQWTTSSGNGYSALVQQVSETSNSATYEIVVSRLGLYVNGFADQLYIQTHDNAYAYCIAIPEANADGTLAWGWNSSGRIYYGSKTYILNSKFMSSNYPLYIPITMWSGRFDVSISRGNNRQGSKSITAGVHSITTPEKDALATITLYTSKVQDPSNLSVKITADSKTVRDRKLKITASFTNPESYYTGNVILNNVTIGSFTSGSFTKEIPITKDMYDKSQVVYLKVVGKDGVQYGSKGDSVKPEPSGVGVTVKQSKNVNKEVQQIFVKTGTGKNDYKEVTEVWLRNNGGKNSMTVK
jgi:hypothetical protein